MKTPSPAGLHSTELHRHQHASELNAVNRQAVVHKTLHCRLYSTSTKLTMKTTCTSTESSTASGCMKPTTTTTYTSSNCPRRPAYTPPWFDYTGAAPTPGRPGWNVYTWVKGTTSTKPTGPTPTSNLNTKPLTREPNNCFKESDFLGYADLQSGDQDRFSVDFSSLRRGMGDDDTPLGPGMPPSHSARRIAKGELRLSGRVGGWVCYYCREAEL